MKIKKRFIFDPYKKLNWIIKYLNDKIGGNISDNGTINIDSSSNQYYYNQSYLKRPKNLLNFRDLNRASMWSPNNEHYATLLYDFKNMKVKLTNYTLHTPNSSAQMIKLDPNRWKKRRRWNKWMQ